MAKARVLNVWTRVVGLAVVLAVLYVASAVFAPVAFASMIAWGFGRVGR
jgi:hypothetical protein